MSFIWVTGFRRRGYLQPRLGAVPVGLTSAHVPKTLPPGPCIEKFQEFFDAAAVAIPKPKATFVQIELAFG